MSTFKKYSSIENSYRQKFLNCITEQCKADGEWTLSEKVHGSNLSIIINDNVVKFAKKSAFIKSGENFYNYQIIGDKYSSNIKSLFNHIKKTKKDVEQVTIFGEIFGGNYPHPEVKNNNDVSCVQKEIHYTPDIDFYGFDIMINAKEYLNQNEVDELFEKFNFFYAKPLFKGTLQECLDFNKEYITNIPTRLGLPTIEGNIAEGNVIKPIEPRFLWSGSRVVIKNKSAKFSEKKNNIPKVKEEIKLSENGDNMLMEISRLVTENRLKNVLSHIGEVKTNDFGRVVGLLNKDVIDDFMKDFDDEFMKLDKKERKIITKNIGRQNAELLRSNYLNIIDGLY